MMFIISFTIFLLTEKYFWKKDEPDHRRDKKWRRTWWPSR